MCRLIENHCQILKVENSWPSEFNCDNETLYPLKICKVNHVLFYQFFFLLTVLNKFYLNICYLLDQCLCHTFIVKLIFMEIMDVQFAKFVYIKKPAMNFMK